MKIIVTGGAGFVGTNLIKRLLKEGHEVTSLDNYSTGFETNHVEGCEYINVDLSDSTHKHGSWNQEKFRLGDCDVIFHLAAIARIQPSLKNPTFTLQNNFNSTLNILEWARKKDIKVVFSGSSSKHHGLWKSPYAWSKFSCEQLCELYHKVYKLQISVCRFYNVYGEHQIEDGEFSTLMGIFMKQYREGKPLTITGDGEQRRDFTHIDDIVDGLIKMGNESFKNCEIFEFGRGENFSVNEIADMFGHTKKYIPARDGEYPTTLCDYSHAKDLLNWIPTKNIHDFIQEFVNNQK